MRFDEQDVEVFLRKWQDILKLRDWDIKHEIVNKEWRKQEISRLIWMIEKLFS